MALSEAQPQVADASGWSRVQDDVMKKLLSILTRDEAWTPVAARFHLVNKHWRDLIRQHFTVVNPHISHPFSLAQDLNALRSLMNMHSFVLKNSQVLHSGNLDATAKQGLNRLENLKIINPAVLEPLLADLCQLSGVTSLFLQDAPLCESALKEHVTKMTSLLSFRLKKNVAVSRRFLQFLKPLTRLEILELPHLGESYLGCFCCLTHLQCLRHLRVEVSNFSLCGMDGLSSLHKLTALVLDGTTCDDELDLSELSQLVHLSISVHRMPLWIEGLKCLKSLSLETWDTFRCEERQNAIFSIAPQLTSLVTEWHEADAKFINRVVTRTENLENLTIERGYISEQTIERCQKLKSLKLVLSKTTRVARRMEIIQSISRLPRLKSLRLNLKKDPTGQDAFHCLRQPCSVTQNLTKLVVYRLGYKSVAIVITHLRELRDCRLYECRFRLHPFRYHPTGKVLPFLTNLCFADCQWFGRPEDTNEFFKLELVSRLKHLALPVQSQENQHVQEMMTSFREKAPHVCVDHDPDWEPDEFQLMY